MKERVGKDYLIIGISLLLGMMLTVLPLPNWAIWARPSWILLIVIFWAMVAPHRFGIGLAWCVGLFMDFLTGTLLGQQALLTCFTAYFIIKLQRRFMNMPIFQQMCLVLLLVGVNLVINRWVVLFVEHSPVYWKFWLTAFSSALIWPWLSGLLNIYQNRFHLVELE